MPCKKFTPSTLFLALLLFCFTATAASITDYHPIFTAGHDRQSNLQIAIRQYQQNQHTYLLLVNPKTLNTQLVATEDFKTDGDMQSLQNTSYLKALNQYSAPPFKLQNYGLTQANHPVQGMFLTIDMCPAKKDFEQDFFNHLVALADKNHQATPIALSMSGMWMTNHPTEFAWLIAQAKAQKLAITWVNHSFTHVYYKNRPLAQNFMLIQPENFDQEVLSTEQFLIEHQQTPSVFFRFPGLVANKELVLKLRALGLIPLGSDAWLAKGEKAQDGSIILVHGNSNEHSGIEKITPLLENSHLRLLPLGEAIQH